MKGKAGSKKVSDDSTVLEKALKVFRKYGNLNEEDGTSEPVLLKHFQDAGLLGGGIGGNGGPWCRDDGPVGKKFHLSRLKKRDILAGDKFDVERAWVDAQRKAHVPLRGILYLQLLGKVDGENEFDRTIRPDIREHFDTMRADGRARSAFDGLSTKDLELDHKDGRYRNTRVGTQDTQRVTDFQLVTKGQNMAKRAYCNNVCVKTGARYDARQRGYRVAQSVGGPRYGGTCLGCWLYDPVAFAAKVTGNPNPPVS